MSDANIEESSDIGYPLLKTKSNVFETSWAKSIMAVEKMNGAFRNNNRQNWYIKVEIYRERKSTHATNQK